LQGPVTKVNAQPRYEKVENNENNSRKKERKKKITIRKEARVDESKAGREKDETEQNRKDRIRTKQNKRKE
jgi:hypothetical protein